MRDTGRGSTIGIWQADMVYLNCSRLWAVEAWMGICIRSGVQRGVFTDQRVELSDSAS